MAFTRIHGDKKSWTIIILKGEGHVGLLRAIRPTRVLSKQENWICMRHSSMDIEAYHQKSSKSVKDLLPSSWWHLLSMQLSFHFKIPVSTSRKILMSPQPLIFWQSSPWVSPQPSFKLRFFLSDYSVVVPSPFFSCWTERPIWHVQCTLCTLWVEQLGQAGQLLAGPGHVTSGRAVELQLRQPPT